MFAGQMNRLPYLLLAWLTAVAPLRAQTRWTLVWSDEFDGPANSAPDQSKWTYDLGAGGWGNHELEVYTDLRENSFLDGKGNLVIRAQRSTSGGYTSARLKTQGKFSTAYGKIEARIKLPYGQGCGQPSGCWALTSTLSAGRRVAKSTLWRILDGSHYSLMGRFTDQDTQLRASQRGTNCRTTGPTTKPFMCLPSSGRQTRSNSSWMLLGMKASRQLQCRPRPNGCSIIPSSFC